MNWKHLSFKKRVMVTIASTNLIFLALFIVFAISSFSRQTHKDQFKMIRETARHVAAQINTDMTAKMTMAQSMARVMAHTPPDIANRDQVIDMLKGWINADPTLVGTFIGYEPQAFDGRDPQFINQPGHDTTGRFVPSWYRDGSGISLFPLVDYETTAWYTEPRRTRADYINQAQLYENILLMGYISPILRQGRFVGVAGVDVELTNMDKMVSAIQVLDSGYAALVSNDGIFISAPDKDMIGKKTLADLARDADLPGFKELSLAVKQGRAGQVHGKDPFSGRPSVFIYEPIQVGTASLILSVPEKEITAPVDRLRNRLILLASVAAALMAALAWFIAGSITRPVSAVTQGVEELAQGDLTLNFKVTRRDEVGLLMDSLNRVSSRMGDMIGKVAQGVDRLKGASNDLVTISGDMGHHAERTNAETEQAARAVEGLSRDMDAATTAADNALETIGVMTRASEEITASIVHVADNTDSARHTVSQAAKQVEMASDQMKELEQAAREIDRVTEVITDISEQTNLLALNATIEAARAGEAGKGFAVVANEIKQLAGLTAQATGDIRDKIKGIQNATSISTASIQDINQTMEMIHGLSADIAASVAQQRQNTEQIVENASGVHRAVDDIHHRVSAGATATQEVSGEISRVNTASQDTARSSESVNTNAQELLALAEALQQQMGRFTIS